MQDILIDRPIISAQRSEKSQKKVEHEISLKALKKASLLKVEPLCCAVCYFDLGGESKHQGFTHLYILIQGWYA